MGQSVNSGGTLTYSSNNTSVATVNSSGTVTIVGAGSATITVTVAASGSYKAGSRTVTVTVNKASPTFSGNTSFSKTYGNAAFSLGQSVNSGGTLTYSSSNTSVATVSSSGTVTIVGAGSATITVTAAATTNYNSGSRTVTVTVAKGTPTVTAPTGKTLNYTGAAQALASAGSTTGGTLYYSLDNSSYSASVPTATNVGTYTVYYKVTGGSNYNDVAAKSVTAKINAIGPTFSGNASFTKTYGDADFSLGQSVNSGGALTYSSNNTSVATVNSSGTVTIVGAGSATITVTAAATTNYTSSSRNVTVTVNPKTPTFSGDTAYNVTYGETVNLKDNITVDSGGTLSFASSNTSILTVNSATGVVTPVAQGTATVTVTAAAIGNYASGTKTVTVTVSRAAGYIKAENYNIQRTPGEKFTTQDIINDAGITTNTNGTLTFTSSDENLVSIGTDGTVTAADKSGTVEIDVTSAQTEQYTAAAIDKKIQLLIGKTVPGAPEFEVTSGENKQVTITWTPPAFTGGDDITGYYILRTHTDADGNEVNKEYEVGLVVDTYVDKDVENGVTYTYRMKARNSIGASVESEPKTAKPYTVPTAPNNLTGAGTGNGSISLSWTAPDYDGGDDITSYRVRVYNDYRYQTEITGDCGISLIQSSDGTFGATVTGLSKATMYYFTVEGVNGAVKDAVSAGTARYECRTWSPPSAPRNLKVRALDENQVKVTWEEPSDNGGTPITSYILYYRDHNDEDDTGVWAIVRDITDLSYTVSELVLGQYYDFKVTAINASDANGGAETDIYVGTPACEPETPIVTKLISSNSSVIIESATCDNIGGDDLIEYRAYYRSPGESEYENYATITDITDNELKNAVIPGLTNGQTYEIAISAVNNYGESGKTETMTITVGLPSTPENMKIVPLTGQQVQVSYSASDANGSEPVIYDLYFGGTYQGATITELTHCTTTDTQYVFDAGERLNGDKVTVYVVARNAAGSSEPTETLSSTIGEPGAPTLLNLETSDSGISLEWSASDPHGNAIVRYNVHIKGSDGTDKVFTHTDLSNLTETITKDDFEFTNKVTYTVTVTCTNSSDINGEGQPSNAMTFTFGAPDMPEITNVDMSSKTLIVSWNKPDQDGGSDITGYNIYLNDDTEPTMYVTWKEIKDSETDEVTGYQLYTKDYRNGDSAEEEKYGEGQDNLESFTVEIGGLANGSSYSVRVTAINENGEGRDETTKESVVPADKAGAPRDVACEPLSGTSGRISWNKPYNNGGATVTDYSVALYMTGDNYNNGNYDDVEIDDVPSKTITTTNGAQTIDVDGLEPGCRYEVRVTPINIAGNGTAGIGELKTHAKPGKAVITELASGVGEESTLPLKVAWTPPTDNGGSPIIGYDIYVNGAYCMNLDGMLSADTTEYTINDVRLENGTSYDITVVTYNEVTGRVFSSGTSSDAKSVMLGTIPPPKDVSVTGDKYGNVVVTWNLDQYTDDVKQYISKFMVYQNGTSVSSVWGTENTKTLTLRPMGTPLKMQVAVLSTFGQLGNLSDPVTITIGAPAQVTNVSAEPRQNGAYITWSYVATSASYDPTEFKVFLNGASEPAETITVDDGDVDSASSALIEGLTGGKEYSITVAAANDKGTGSTELEGTQSEAVTVTPYSKPDAPIVKDITPGVGEFSFEFTEPNGNGADITGYKVYVDDEEVSAEFNGTTATITGVINGTPHYFTVTAINSYGLESDKQTDPYEVTTGTPVKPENVTAEPGSGSVTVSFDAVPDVSLNYKNLKYEIYRGSGESASLAAEVTPIEGVERYSQKITGLSNGTSYTFTVRAVNLLGNGVFSDPVTATAGTPYAPKITNITSGNGSLTIEWTTPDGNGLLLMPYTIYLYNEQSGKFEEVFERTGNSGTIDGLTNGKAYTIKVTARNYYGESSSSDPAVGIPGTTPEAVTNIKGEAGYVEGKCNITLTWDAPTDDGGTPITKYIVEGIGENAVSDENIVVDSTGRTAVISNLESNTEYEFSVLPINGAGEGKIAESGAIRTLSVPDAPTLIGADGVNKKITVTWQSNDDTTRYYMLYVKPLSGGDTIAIKVSDAEPNSDGEYSYVISDGLTVGEKYNITVTAVNVVGESDTSNSTRVTVSDEIVKAKPSAPQNLTVTSGDKSATLTWSAPASDGNDTITGYTIYRGPSETDMGPITNGKTDGYTFSFTDTGLTNGTTYYYKVKAINATSGNEGGPFCDPVSVTPLKIAAPSTPQWQTFSNENGTSAYESNAQQNAVTITWQASTEVADSLPVTYTVLVNGEEAQSSTETSYVLKNPVESVLYNVQIKATNAKGVSSVGDFIRVRKGLNIRKGSAEDGFEYPSQYADNTYAYIDADYDGVEDNQIVIGAPGVPQAFDVTTAETGDGLTAVLTWEPPESNGNADITSYNVYITKDGVSQETVEVTPTQDDVAAASTTLEYDCAIDYGSAYTFEVTAVNAESYESSATQTKLVFKAKSTALSKPDGFTAEKDENKKTNINLTWTTVEGATGYILYVNGSPRTLTEASSSAEPDVVMAADYDEDELIVAAADESEVVVEETEETDSTTDGYTVDDNGTASYTYQGEINVKYTFMISALNGTGESAVSTSQSVDTTETPPNAPNEVTLALNGDGTGVTATWSEPDPVSGVEIKGYVIRLNGDTVMNADTGEALIVEGTTYTIDGTGTCFVKVAAVSTYGTLGAYSETVSYIATSEGTPSIADNAPPMPTDISEPEYATTSDGLLDADADTNMTITWTAGAGEEGRLATEGYNVYVNGEQANEGVLETASFSTKVEAGKSYYIEIEPVGYDTENDNSIVVGERASTTINVPDNEYAAPEEINDFTAILSEDESTVTLTWTEVTGLTYKLVVNGVEQDDTIENGYEYAIQDDDGTNITFKIVAVKTYSDGTVTTRESDEKTVTLTGNTGGDDSASYDMDPPIIVNYISDGTSKVKIFWKAADKRDGETGDIVKYGIKTATSGGTLTETNTVTPTATTLGGLECYELSFTSVTERKDVAIVAYKEISGKEIPLATSETMTVTPLCNNASEDDYDNSNPDANVTNTDTDMDGSTDTVEEKLTITGKSNTTGITIAIIDEYGNSIGGDVTMGDIVNGMYEFTAEFATNTLRQGSTFTVKVARTCYTSYEITNINSYEELSTVTMNSVELYAGDIISDGNINAADISKFNENMGTSGKTIYEGDFTGDGLVNAADKGIFLANIYKSDISVEWKPES